MNVAHGVLEIETSRSRNVMSQREGKPEPEVKKEKEKNIMHAETMTRREVHGPDDRPGAP